MITIYFILKIFSLIILCVAFPAHAKFDPVTLMESIRNNKLNDTRIQLAESGEAELEYLRRYAVIFLPAIARIGSLDALTLIVDKLGKDSIKEALDYALVMVFDNPKFDPFIKPLLSMGANPSARAFGQTALARAAFAHARRSEKKGLDAVKLFLKYNINPDVAEDSGMTPLMWACSSDDEELIKVLLIAGANPEIRPQEGRTASMMAGPLCTKLLASKIQNTANELTKNKDELMAQALYQAVVTNDIIQSKELLQQGAATDFIIDDTGQNFLMKARNADILKMLLQYGANPYWTDIKGWDALHRVITCSHIPELVKILLESGAKMQRRVENGQNALLLTHLLFVDKLDAVSGKEILQLLVQYGADINSRDKDGETLLHLAAYNNAADLAQIALELGANPNLPNQRGETPLRLANRLKVNEVLEILTKQITLNITKTLSSSNNLIHITP